MPVKRQQPHLNLFSHELTRMTTNYFIHQKQHHIREKLLLFGLLAFLYILVTICYNSEPWNRSKCRYNKKIKFVKIRVNSWLLIFAIAIHLDYYPRGAL